jgi:hypothetical protein
VTLGIPGFCAGLNNDFLPHRWHVKSGIIDFTELNRTSHEGLRMHGAAIWTAAIAATHAYPGWLWHSGYGRDDIALSAIMRREQTGTDSHCVYGMLAGGELTSIEEMVLHKASPLVTKINTSNENEYPSPYSNTCFPKSYIADHDWGTCMLGKTNR